MRHRRTAATLLIIATTAAADDTALRKQDPATFCRHVGATLRSPKPDPAVLRVAHDYGITPAHHPPIRQRQLAIGMTACAVIAAIGPADKINRTVTARGEDWQLVYRNPERYVYLVNFKVIGWQD